MKQAQNARQQRGRPSSRQGGKSNRGPGNHRNEQKSRGNPKQLVDKYQNQARECLQAGDRMQAEYFFQFAEHYYRVLNENRNNNANNANQGDRDGQPNNNRRQNSQNGEQSGNDGPQGGRHNRRGRRGRPQDDQNNTTSNENKVAVEQQNGAAPGDVKQPVEKSDAPQQVAKPEQPVEASAEKPMAAEMAAAPAEIKEASSGEQVNGSVPAADSDSVKSVKRRAPRKRSVASEKPAAEAPLDPAVSDLS